MGRLGAEDPGPLHAQRRSHALAAGEHRVPHRLLQPSEPLLFGEPEPVQVLLEGAPVRLPPNLALRHAGPVSHAPPRREPAAQRPAAPRLRTTEPPHRRTPWRARWPR